MKYLTGIVLLLSGFWLPAQTGDPKDRAESLSDSPARQRLNEIQPYKPVVRRSRTIAIEELENQIAVATLRLQKADKLIALEQKKMNEKADDAWTPTQMAAAEEAKEGLEAYLDEARNRLQWAVAENEKVTKFMNRDSTQASVAFSSEGDGEEGETEEGVAPASSEEPKGRRRRPPRPKPEISDDPPEDAGDEEDN